MTEKEAKKKSYEDLEQKYKKKFFKFYRDSLEFNLELEGNHNHQKIRTEVRDLIKDGYAPNKAVKQVVTKNAHIFEELFDGDSSDSDESEADEGEGDVEGRVQIGKGDNDTDWGKIFKDMAEGKIPHTRRYYTIPQPPQEGGATSGVTLITPTEQQVEIAQSEVKRQIEAATKSTSKRRKTNAQKRYSQKQ